MVNGMTKEMELEKKEEEGLNLADYGFMFQQGRIDLYTGFQRFESD